MNKCSTYVLKHILSFVKNSEINLLPSMNKTFKQLIYNDVRYKINLIYQEWTHVISLKVLNEHKDDLDILQQSNGNYIFCTVHFDDNFVIPDMLNVINYNPSLFIDFYKLNRARISFITNI